MRELKKQLFIRRDEIGLVLALEFGVFVLAVILFAFIMRFADADTVVQIGTITGLGAALFVVMFFGLGAFAQSFNLGASMGTARRRIVPFYIAITYVEFLLVCAEAYVLYQLETWSLRTFYPAMEIESGMENIFQWKYLFIGALAAAAWNMFFGALFLKFGKIAFILLWVLWVGVFAGASRVSQFLEKYGGTPFGRAVQSVLDHFQNAAEGGIFAGIAAVSLLLIVIAWMLLRRQQVKL